jgi:hypothetical protein
MARPKTVERPAASKKHAAYAVITRSLIGESGFRGG